EERFDIYTNAFAVEELGYVGAAGIVIARNGEIIAELSRIEEIFVDGMGGGDEFDIRGDFGDTSLLTNTITINGTEGDDTVNISGLESEHRVVFHSNGGSDTIVGDLRPQDVIETEADQVVVDTGDGTTSIAPPAAPDDGGTNNDPGNGGAAQDTAAAPMMLVGGDTDDNLIGGAGNDTAAASGGNDNVIGQDGDDVLLGGAGDDVILAGAGNDLVLGGQGMDYILAGEGDDWIQSGADRDVVDAGSGNDTIVASFGDGDDVYRGGDGEDTYDLAAITSDALIDLGLGVATSEQSGQDSITRIENVIAGAGDDTIVAGSAANVFSGGIGDDTFVFNSVEAAQGDTIADFAPGDAIDLSGIAAQYDLGQSFTLLGEDATFSQAGQLIVRAADDGVYVDGNVDGDAQAEFTIKVNGATNLDQDDFV
ncbi:MAG: calcium-binding protein, partial [Hyphomicrobiaceae bacterium]